MLTLGVLPSYDVHDAAVVVEVCSRARRHAQHRCPRAAHLRGWGVGVERSPAGVGMWVWGVAVRT